MADYRALYRKWRPRDFDDVCGQEAVTDILKYEVANGKISHAYLFCGSRGTGKTSCAKILAKAVNCLHPKDGNPCGKCEACLSVDRGTATDVIEMDAASNNGVDNVRDLKDEIAFTPAQLRYRVYIIDEVHMMSGSAFNALLKTLEEPPPYVVFILATTEFNKLPTTIVSRCQRFDFRRIRADVIMERLKKIAGAEKIQLTDEGARLLARAAQGGMRDAISLLELCAGARRPIDEALVSSTVGAGNRENAYRMLGALSRADFAGVYQVIGDVSMLSTDISVFIQDLTDAYRDMMVVRTTDHAKEYLDLTEGEYAQIHDLAEKFTMAKMVYHTGILQTALADMQRSVNAKRAIAEIALTRMCDPKQVASADALAVRVEELEKQVSMLRLGVPVSSGVPVAESVHADTPVRPSPEKPTPSVTEKSSSAGVPYARFASVVERIGEIKRSLSVQFIGAACLKTAENAFTLVMSPFFAKKLSENVQDLAIVRGLLAEEEGCQPADIRLTVTEKGNKGTADPAEEIARAAGKMS